MSKESETGQREAFEKWADECGYNCQKPLNPLYSNMYDDERVNIALHAWQAAQHQDRELISELVGALKTCTYEDTLCGPRFWFNFDMVEDVIAKAQKRLKEV